MLRPILNSCCRGFQRKPGRAQRLFQRGKYIFNGSIVAERFADVREQVFVSRSKHKTSAELEGVFAQAMLAHTKSLCALAGTRIVAAKEVKDVGLLQLQGLIGLAIGVDEDREIDLCIVAKM